jgi:hypothetical protein
MSASAAKKNFLRNLPAEVRYRSLWGYRIPSELNARIFRFYKRETFTNRCKDYRDFLSKLALQGLEEATNGGGNIMQIASDYGGQCRSPVYIDYAVIDSDRLLQFSRYVDNNYVKCVQDAVSYSIILGYATRIAQVECDEPRGSRPIYS